MRIPNPVAYRCRHCGHPAVVVEYPTGLHPVHCGTYRATCAPAHAVPPGDPRAPSLVSAPPATGTAPRRGPRLRLFGVADAHRWLARRTRP
jgi:hypothetical protein